MRPVMILAALAALALAPPSFAQKVDKNGRCHDASGKFAKAEVCNGAPGAKTAGSEAKSAASGAGAAVTGASASVERGASKTAKGAAAAVDPNGPYKLDSKGKCHDAKGKMAAKAKCA
jgi:hypothetical protein